MMHETERAEGAILVGVERKGESDTWTVLDSLHELGQLALTAGLEIAGSTYQKLARPDPGTWIGSGKVAEVREILAAKDVHCVVFDGELSPGQQKKLEKGLGEGIRVIDRTRLILDIFSQHAHSREGKLQVELAQYQYLLPRLSGMRAGLSQQVGGTGAGPVGLRGPGETQLEQDRRQVRRRIQVLRREIEEVRGHRQEGRRHRERAMIPVVALVGYTNAGKSSLLNALTGAEVLVQDKLFATLDPTIRRLRLPGGREILLTDTVGFIRKLPHDLVAAFRATLEGVEEAALLVHVVDGAHPRALDHIQAVESVLADLGALDTPRLIAWNKIDLKPSGSDPALPRHPLPESVPVSAKTGENLGALLYRIDGMLGEALLDLDLVIPYDRFDLVNLVYAQGVVSSREETPRGVLLRASVPRQLADRLAPFSAEGEIIG